MLAPTTAEHAMCGICGRTSDAAGTAVAAMNARMVHRGPDDDGVHVDPAGVALGARRLSIIDLTGGHQPLANEDGSVWAVLNGEIYNHRALQSHLRANGHTLRSTCDTEVLVHLYEDHGDALVHALEGMFAFALWDAGRRRLLIARDRFGEKPLFFAATGPTLTFASELTALVAGMPGPAPDIDADALADFLVLGYLAGHRTMFEGVSALPPGHLLRWDLERRVPEVSAYWRPPIAGAGGAALGDVRRELGPLLERSVRGRMIADVPLGVFLSGGLDSTLVAGLAVSASSAPVKTFTVGYDTGRVNELDAARDAAIRLGTDHHELVVGADEVAAEVPDLLRRLDQPIADPALVPLHLLCRLARREVTVAVGGEGADELFGGYPRYRWLVRADRLAGVVPPRVAATAAGALRGRPGRRWQRLADVVEPKPLLDRHLDWVTDGRRHTRVRVEGPALRSRRGGLGGPQLASFAPDGDVAASFMALDQRQWLPDDVLAKADRASMLTSLELRTPFLHRELAELAAAVSPAAHLAHGGKALLRAALADLDGGTLRPGAKTAFRVPTAEWLRGPLAPELRDQLRHGRVFAEGWLDRRGVGGLVAEHAAGAADHSGALWPVFCLGIWLDSVRGDGR
jgi:asparagine synthase (glutamine-hydrolysing)